MATYTTTETIESKTRVIAGYEVFDLFFMFIYLGATYIFSGMVHPRLYAFYYIFSFLMAGFLTTKSALNKKRRNFESIYFLIIRSKDGFRPIVSKEV